MTVRVCVPLRKRRTVAPFLGLVIVTTGGLLSMTRTAAPTTVLFVPEASTTCSSAPAMPGSAKDLVVCGTVVVREVPSLKYQRYSFSGPSGSAEPAALKVTTWFCRARVGEAEILATGGLFTITS